MERFLQFWTVLSHALDDLLCGLGVSLPFCVVVEVATSKPIDDHIEDVACVLECRLDLHKLFQLRSGNVAQGGLYLLAQFCIHGNSDY